MMFISCEVISQPEIKEGQVWRWERINSDPFKPEKVRITDYEVLAVKDGYVQYRYSYDNEVNWANDEKYSMSERMFRHGTVIIKEVE
jgi:hypothetical protein